MKAQEKRILQLLYKEIDFVSGSMLQEITQIPTRSISRYIASLNETHPNIIISSRSGYKLNKEVFHIELLSNDSKEAYIPQSPKDRLNYIIQKIIMEPNPVNVDELEFQLFVSESTIRADLIKTKEYFKNFNLDVKINEGLISLVGAEDQKRRLISDFIYNESKTDFLSITSLFNYFPDFHLQEISNHFQSLLTKNRLYLDDFSYNNFMLHLAISLHRADGSQNNNPHKTANNNFATLPIIAQLNQYIIKLGHISIPTDDANALAYFLDSKTNANSLEGKNSQELDAYIGKELRQLVEYVLNEVNNYYFLHLSSPYFVRKFSIHLKSAIQRLQDNIIIKNPLAHDIRESVPFVYEVATFTADILSTKLKLEFPDDEIAYIALHYATEMEEETRHNHLINAIVICPEFYNINENLIKKLNNSFNNELNIIEVASSDTHIKCYNNIDLIISTIKVNPIEGCEYFQINPLVSNKELSYLGSLINRIKNRKENNRFINKFRHVFNDTIFNYSETSTYPKIINQLANQLHAAGYVNTSYAEAILKRELLSPTSFTHHAIPHPIHMNSKKTGIAVAILQEPINWINDIPVKFIFMLAIQKEDMHFMKDLFHYISAFFDSHDNIEALSKVRDTQGLIEVLSNATIL